MGGGCPGSGWRVGGLRDTVGEREKSEKNAKWKKSEKTQGEPRARNARAFSCGCGVVRGWAGGRGLGWRGWVPGLLQGLHCRGGASVVTATRAKRAERTLPHDWHLAGTGTLVSVRVLRERSERGGREGGV